jgi:DNA polymerase-1
MKPRLVAERMTRVYETLERPLSSCWRGWNGAASRSTGRCCRGSRAISPRPPRASKPNCQELAGEPINVGSPKQIGDILFGKMGILGGTKTKTGAWSTSAQILDELAEQGHEFPKKILEWRQVSKLKSTYTDALPNYCPSADPSACHTTLRAGRHHHRAAVVQRAVTCRIFRSAPRMAARSAAPL